MASSSEINNKKWSEFIVNLAEFCKQMLNKVNVSMVNKTSKATYYYFYLDRKRRTAIVIAVFRENGFVKIGASHRTDIFQNYWHQIFDKSDLALIRCLWFLNFVLSGGSPIEMMEKIQEDLTVDWRVQSERNQQKYLVKLQQFRQNLVKTVETVDWWKKPGGFIHHQ